MLILCHRRNYPITHDVHNVLTSHTLFLFPLFPKYFLPVFFADNMDGKLAKGTHGS